MIPDRRSGASWNRVISTDAKAVIAESARRYVRAATTLGV